MKLGLRFKMVLFFVIVAALPMIVGAVWTFRVIDKQSESAVLEQNNLIASGLKEKVEQIIKDQVEVNKTLAAMPGILRMDPGELKSLLASVQENNSAIGSVGIINTEGIQIAGSSGSEPPDLKDKTYFKEALSGKDSVSEVLISGNIQKPIVIVASPIRENGSVRGIIHTDLKLDEIAALVNSAQRGEGYSFIVDGSGKVVAHPDSNYSPGQKDLGTLDPVKSGLAAQTGTTEYTAEGVSWLAGYTQSPLLKWVIVTQQPKTKAAVAIFHMLTTILGALALVVVLALLMGAVLSNKIVRPILQIKEEMVAIADCNLTRDEDVVAGDEIGLLADSVDKTRATLKNIIGQLVESGQKLGASAGHLSSQARQTSSGATEAASTIEEIAYTVDEVSQNLQAVSLSSEDAVRAAVSGANGVEILTSQMANITAASQGASRVIESLTTTLQQINQVVNIITSIAEQTNLLALNAAIESARAGEQGKGFAVVAEEVRKLAEKSAQAAKNIGQMIDHIQIESEQAVTAMATGADRVKEGAVVVDQVGQEFEAILTAVNGLAKRIHEVAGSAEQVSRGIQNVAAATQEQTAAMEEVTASAEELTRMSSSLNELAGMFRV